MSETADLFGTEPEPKSAKPETLELVERVEKIRNKAKSRRPPNEEASAVSGSTVSKYPQTDFFVANFVDVSLRSDIQTMDMPIFSLSTKKDTDIFPWESPDGSRWLEVAPSAFGRATMLDKDVLIFLASQMTAAINEGKAVSRRIRFTTYDFLLATNRDTSGRGYRSLLDALARLRGTTFKIGDREDRRGRVFGLIESADIESNTNGRQLHIDVVISENFFDSIVNHQILAVNKDYFTLSSLLERRLYEIARKHTGTQGMWSIGLDNLLKKTGSKRELKKFKFELKKIIAEDSIPDYRMTINGDKVIFYDKDPSRLVKRIC